MFSKTDIEQYFVAEKQGSIFFLAVGIAAIVAALVCFFAWKISFAKGMMIPLLIVGTIAAIIGATVYKRSDADRQRNVYAYDLNPDELKQKEYPRMQKVMKSFRVIIVAEVLLLLVGTFLYFYFRQQEARQFVCGLGFGLLLMCVAALILDLQAQRRAAAYMQGLQSFLLKTN
ncbi:MAG: hypothetical protein GXC73_19835 [Chitinophagaceae bacterium]|nr:hypothetical protein [Chitinophagaceae bacterium]